MFAVTSSSQIKVDNVKKILEEILSDRVKYTVVSCPGKSNVSEQPLSLDETKRGALNRIFNVENPEADFFVSVESGAEREFDQFYAFTCAAVSNKTKTRFGFGTSSKFPVSDDAATVLENGQQLSSMPCGLQGLIGHLTNGLFTRANLIRESVLTALIPFHVFPIPVPSSAPPELTRFISRADPISASQLASQLASLDFSMPGPLADTAVLASNLKDDSNSENQKIEIGDITIDPDLEEAKEDIMANGSEALKNGEVAVVILAGGQGSRLGAAIPKGLLALDIPSHSTLLELQLRRIRKLLDIYKSYNQGSKGIPTYILTSEDTHSALAAYLIRNRNFGVPHVRLVKQPRLPARLPDFHFALSNLGKVCAAPNGNGAVFACLKQSGALKEMKELGVQYVDIHPIDNALNLPADPYFVGAMIYEGADAALKVIKKRPGERVGTVCIRNQKTSVVEYSELSALAGGAEGAEKYVWGNTAMHLFSIDLIEKAADAKLKYHVARKKERILNDEGNIVESEVLKFERFIFDALDYAENVAIVPIIREEEFAPVKNASGAPVDSPETAKELLLNLHKKWAKDADIQFEGTGEFEFRPATTYFGEGLDKLGFEGMKITLNPNEPQIF